MKHRRDFFRSAAKTGLALGLAAAGRPLIALPEPGKAPAPGDDILLLNTALALEHEAIWAYGLAGKSGLLSEKAKEVGLLFQGSHEIHRDLVADAIKRKGGTPVEPQEGIRLRRAVEPKKTSWSWRSSSRSARRAPTSPWWTSSRTARCRRPQSKILSDEVLHATVLRSVLGKEVVPQFRLIEN